MTIGFLRPVGANADVKELEYVSALHQTAMPNIRHDGSIRDVDIVLFLKSRYGIEVTEDEVQKTILQGMGGGRDVDGVDDVIDLMEMVSILLIPTLLKAAKMNDDARREARREARKQRNKLRSLAGYRDDEEIAERHFDDNQSKDADSDDDEDDDPVMKTSRDDFNSDFDYEAYMKTKEDAQSLMPPPGILKYVLDMILHDVTGSRRPKPLTTSLLRRIFTSYGEQEIAQDDSLLEQMVIAATEGSGVGSSKQKQEKARSATPAVLDVEVFARGLTGDVLLYDIKNETKWTTNYYDVFRTYQSTGPKHNFPLVRARLAANQEQHEALEEDEAHRQREEDIYRARLEERPVRKRWTAAEIDFPAGTFRSKWMVVSIWLLMVLTFRAFLYGNLASFDTCDVETHENEFGCHVTVAVLVWIYRFFAFSAYGVVFLGLGMLGNSIENTNPFPVIVSMVVLSFFTLAFPLSYLLDGRGDSGGRFLYTMCVLMAVMTLIIQILYLVNMFIPRNWLETHPRLRRFLTPGTVRTESAAKRSTAYKINRMTKNALEVATLNERDNVIETHFGQALLAFNKIGKKYEETGGFAWTWGRVWRRELANQEGISLHARVITTNVAMVIITILILFAGREWYIKAQDDFSKQVINSKVDKTLDDIFRKDVDEDLVNTAVGNVSVLVSELMSASLNETASENCTAVAADLQSLNDTGCGFLNQSSMPLVPGISEPTFQCENVQSATELCGLLRYGRENPAVLEVNGVPLASFDAAVLNSGGFDIEGAKNIVRNVAQKYADDTVDNNYPSERYMITIPLAVGIACAFLTSLYLTAVYIPSVTSTILQFRCGEIPTFRNPQFWRYRVAADQSTILMGSIFWGTWFSSILVGGLVGSIIFLSLWQVTAATAKRVYATLIGIVVTILVKITLLQTCRVNFAQAFYRRRVAGSNLVSVALEAANFALSVGFVGLRGFKLVLCALLYIGRVDTPFLARGVGRLGRIELDNYPTIFRKDILAHEAHRHPYLELLGVMYMMKLRYGENFGKTAGSCWRLMFVYALMPWLCKYRILARPEVEEADVRASIVGTSRSAGASLDTIRATSDQFISLRNLHVDRDLELDSLKNDADENEKTLRRGSVLFRGRGATKSATRPEDKNEEEVEVVHPDEKMREMAMEIEELRNHIRYLQMKDASTKHFRQSLAHLAS